MMMMMLASPQSSINIAQTFLTVCHGGMHFKTSECVKHLQLMLKQQSMPPSPPALFCYFALHLLYISMMRVKQVHNGTLDEVNHNKAQTNIQQLINFKTLQSVCDAQMCRICRIYFETKNIFYDIHALLQQLKSTDNKIEKLRYTNTNIIIMHINDCILKTPIGLSRQKCNLCGQL